jgi:hypothetical protein
MNIAFRIRTRNLPMAEAAPGVGEVVLEGEGGVVALVDTVGDIVGYGSEGSQFLGILIADLDAKLFFDGHQCFEDIQGVETKVVIQGSIWGQVCLIDAQLFVKNELYFARNL